MNETLPRRGNSPAARDIASLVHPYTNLRVHEKDGPLVIERGRGVYVYDDSGKEYIEGMAGLWSAAIGFDELIPGEIAIFFDADAVLADGQADAVRGDVAEGTDVLLVDGDRRVCRCARGALDREAYRRVSP